MKEEKMGNSSNNNRMGFNGPLAKGNNGMMELNVSVRGRSALSDVSSDISPSPLYIPPHRR